MKRYVRVCHVIFRVSFRCVQITSIWTLHTTSRSLQLSHLNQCPPSLPIWQIVFTWSLSSTKAIHNWIGFSLSKACGRFTRFSMATSSLTCCLSFFLAPPPCSTPVDLAFIIDSSGSIGRTNYKKQKNFVKEVAKTFGLSPNGSRAAMVLYSNSASVKARFGQYTDPKEFDGAVDSLPYERGLTRIDKALDLTARDIFAQSRSGVPKIAMLITDGTQTAAADAKGLKEASEPLRQAGVRVLAVGIGRGVIKEELRLVTESDEDVVLVANFINLLLKLSNLISQVCRLAGEHHQKSVRGTRAAGAW